MFCVGFEGTTWIIYILFLDRLDSYTLANRAFYISAETSFHCFSNLGLFKLLENDGNGNIKIFH